MAILLVLQTETALPFSNFLWPVQAILGVRSGMHHRYIHCGTIRYDTIPYLYLVAQVTTGEDWRLEKRETRNEKRERRGRVELLVRTSLWVQNIHTNKKQQTA